MCAVQILYSSELTDKTINQQVAGVMSDKKIFLDEENTASQLDIDFLKNLLAVYEVHTKEIDELISKNLSTNWNFARLGHVMVSILRLGVTELAYLQDIPSNVVFNEYIEITKAFFGESESSFVNGILNTVAKSCQKNPQNEEVKVSLINE